MKLVGMFDSPYVRRVAISMRLLDLPFEHLNWSIGKDQDRVKQLNPLGQVPILVLDDGEALVDSATILDYLDDRVGAERALVPRSAAPRRCAIRRCSSACTASCWRRPASSRSCARLRRRRTFSAIGSRKPTSRSAAR